MSRQLVDLGGETEIFAGFDHYREGEGMWAPKPYVSTAFEGACSYKNMSLPVAK